MFSIIKSFILLCVFNCEKYYFPFPHYIIYAVNVKCFIRQEHAFITIPYERDVHTLLGIMLHVALCRPKRRAFYARQRVFYGIKKRKKTIKSLWWLRRLDHIDSDLFSNVFSRKKHIVNFGI